MNWWIISVDYVLHWFHVQVPSNQGLEMHISNRFKLQVYMLFMKSRIGYHNEYVYAAAYFNLTDITLKFVVLYGTQGIHSIAKQTCWKQIFYSISLSLLKHSKSFGRILERLIHWSQLSTLIWIWISWHSISIVDADHICDYICWTIRWLKLYFMYSIMASRNCALLLIYVMMRASGVSALGKFLNK